MAEDAAPTTEIAEGPRGWSLWPAIAVLCVVHAVFLSETLFGGKILTQIDALLLFEPWASVAPPGFEASNVLLLDQATGMLPYLEFCAERVAAGEAPLWNPHVYTGQPLGGMPTACMFWPPNWVYFALPSWHFHAWHAWARLVAAGIFTLLLLRELGTSRAAATLGAIAFSLCGFTVLWLNHPHTNASIFLPLLLWFVERAARRPSWRLAGGVAFPVALSLLSGHPQSAAQVLLATGAYAVLRLLLAVGGVRLGGRGIARLAAGGVAGVLMAMPQNLLFLDYLRVSVGGNVSATLKLVADVDPRAALWFLFDPDHFGHPLRGGYSGPVGPHLNFQELAGVFAGRVALALALVGAWLRRRERLTWIFGAGALLAGLVAYQVPPFYDAARLVPVVNNTKLLRLVMVVAFCVAVLGARGLDALLARLRGRARLAVVLVPLVAAVELGLWGHGYNPALERDDPTFLPATPATDFLAQDDSLFRVLGHEGSMLIPNANLFYGIDMVTGYDSMEYATLVELASRLSSDERARFYLKEARVFDRLDRLPLASLMNVKYVLATIELPAPLVRVLDGPVKVYENPSVLPRAFVARGYEVVEDREARLDRLSATDLDPLVAVLERAGDAPEGVRPAPDAPPGSVRVESYEPRRVVLEAELSEPGLVVLSDSWDAAWSATVDGEPAEILRVDHHFRGVRVGAGRSVVEMRHAPRSFTLGLWLAALGLAAAVAALLMRPSLDAR